MRSTLFRQSVMRVAIAMTFGIALPAQAQEASAPASAANEAQDAGDSNPAAAQQTARNTIPSDDPSEVIVTARRIEERLQDVPISMTVFSQEQLTAHNVVGPGDLAAYTPSLTANTRYSSESASFAIRGFSQEVRTTASVGMYFADVVAPRAGGSVPAGDNGGPGIYFDLQNIQVLKGPQGTLFGRNTTGGAILLVPQKPTNTLEGYVEQSYGNYGMNRTQAVVNVPVADWARLRFGMDKLDRDGYIDNTSGIGPRHFSDTDYLAFRASLVLNLTDNLENYTIASTSDSSNNGPLPKLTACNPSVGLGAFACPQVARQQAAGYYTAENADPTPEIALKTSQLINTTTWLASDTLTVKNILSYSELTNNIRSELFGDNFYSPTPSGGYVPLLFNTARPAPGMSTSDQSTMSEELQFQGRTEDDVLTWQAGFYGERSRPVATYGSRSPVTISCENSDTLECYDVLGDLNGLQGYVGGVLDSRNRQTYTNLGAYAQGSYALTDALKATLGIRYTKDKTEADTQSVMYRFPSENNPESHCGTDPIGAPALDPATCMQHLEKKSSAPTWMVGLDYKYTPDLLLYGKYSRGYRQGSVVLGAPPGYETYDPETVDTYELGFKSSFDSFVRGTFNAALFYNDFTDQQILATFSNSQGAAATTVAPINAGGSRIYGAEVESSLRLFNGFTVDLSYAYLNTKVTSLDAPTADPAALYDVVVLSTSEGSRLTYTPTNKVSATATYHLPLPTSIGRVLAGATYTYTSSQLIVEGDAKINKQYGELNPLSLVSANLGWMSIYGGPVDISAFATNLLNKKYASSLIGTYAAAGFTGEYAGEPRMFGARVRVNFGQ